MTTSTPTLPPSLPGLERDCQQVSVRVGGRNLFIISETKFKYYTTCPQAFRWLPLVFRRVSLCWFSCYLLLFTKFLALLKMHPACPPATRGLYHKGFLIPFKPVFRILLFQKLSHFSLHLFLWHTLKQSVFHCYSACPRLELLQIKVIKTPQN